ncbi:MAG: hypothetical protein ACD_5C00179G0008 [uncultured bacterium]|nr:MAG: hypothetical protein ACD_5C00179G0008 [uncultured bacterium]
MNIKKLILKIFNEDYQLTAAIEEAKRNDSKQEKKARINPSLLRISNLPNNHVMPVVIKKDFCLV